MRDVERPIQKGAGAFRILVLGDSFMEAFQVPLDQSFPRLLEARLRSVVGCQVEVWNASVSGWGTDDEVTYFARHGKAVGPDLVLLVMTLHNDITDNLRQRFHEIVDGKLYERPPVPLPLATFLAYKVKSALARNSHAYQIFLSASHARENTREALLLDRSVADILMTQSNARMERGWALTGALIRKLHGDAERIRAGMALVLIPISHQMSENTLDAFLVRHGIRKDDSILLDRPQRLARAIAEREGFPAVDLLPEFQRWSATHRESLFLDDGHWNVQGHALAASVSADSLLHSGGLGGCGGQGVTHAVKPRP
jgi:lysophospholipase L1-like esterase